MKYLIAGLGNIGPEYHETRHNIGFMVVDALAQAAGITFNDGRYGFTATMSVKGRQLILLGLCSKMPTHHKINVL